MNGKYLIIISLLPIVVGMADPEIKDKGLEIRLKNHQCAPKTGAGPAGTAVQIAVLNLSRERIEFESFRLNREKVVEPGGAVIVKLPALRAGSYDFFDDFHADVPEGTIIAK